MRLLVTGGRFFADRKLLNSWLDLIDDEADIDTLLHGDQDGADKLAHEWALDNGTAIVRYPALWTIHGKKAGPIRDKQMVVEGRPDLLLAFDGAYGTAKTISYARKANVPIIEAYFPIDAPVSRERFRHVFGVEP